MDKNSWLITSSWGAADVLRCLIEVESKAVFDALGHEHRTAAVGVCQVEHARVRCGCLGRPGMRLVRSVVICHRAMDNGPMLSRTRVTVGLLVVVAGTAWAVGDADELRRAGRLALIILPTLFVVVAVVMVVRAAMPAGTAAGPVAFLVLAAGCLLAAAMVFGWVSMANLTETSAIVVTGGGMAVALSRRRTHHELDAIIRRRTAALLTRAHLRILGDAPAKSVVRAILGGTVHLDLSAAEFPADAEFMVVDITSWYGRVVISVPAGWQVQAGRVELARRMQYDGDLDTWNEDADRRVVLNIQGLGGYVGLRRRR